MGAAQDGGVGLFGQIASYLGFTSRFSDSSHLAQITLDDFLGTLPDHIAVTQANALTVGTVGAARNTIVMTSARLPMHAYKDGVRTPFQPSILQQFERGVPMATTMGWTYEQLFFEPHAWWHVLERDSYGWPIFGETVPLERATFDSENRLVEIDRKPVQPQDLIRFDSPYGVGFLARARKTIQRAIAIELAAALAEDNPVPSIELHNEAGTPLTAAQRTKLIEDWVAARRKQGVAYTPKGLKVIPHGQQPAQLLIDGRKALSLDLVRHATVPAWAAATAIEGATMTYDNRALHNFELLDLNLAAFHTAVHGRLSMPDITPRGWAVRVETDELTRPDEKTRFETYKIGLEAGFIDNEWIAAREGWDRTMGGSK